MKNTVNIILSLIFSINSNLFCQTFKLYNTKEMQINLSENGIDSLFKDISPRIPLYIIDPVIARQIALKCKFDNVKQNDFFLNSTNNIKDSLLAKKVIKYLQYIRANIDINNSHTWITPNLIFKSIIYQNDTNLISDVLKEYEFWKSLGDSLFPYTDTNQHAYSDTNIMHYRAQYNYFKLANVLLKLGANKFNKEEVIKLGTPNFTLNDLNSIVTFSLNSRADTVILKKYYNAISEIDFKYESRFNILPTFGQILINDNDFAVLYYNLNHGLFYHGHYLNSRDSKYQLLEITLIERNKLIIRHISGGIS